MNCQDLLKQINEYVDGHLEPGVCDELREHLKDCNPCRVVVDNIRNTITIYKNDQPIELPLACREKLHRLLKDQWKQKFPTAIGENDKRS